MTAIVGVLNSQGIAIAADSAVTVTGNKVKKVYNRSNKIFTLSKFHPVGIAIYNSAEYLGIPLETIIKMYRKNLGDNSFPTLEEYKTDFLTFLQAQIPKVGIEYLRSAYFSFCFESYNAIITNTIQKLEARQAEIDALNPAGQSAIFSAEFDNAVNEYNVALAKHPPANYTQISLADYCAHYESQLTDINNHIETEIAAIFFTKNIL